MSRAERAAIAHTLLPALFVLSGAAALVYEVAWLRLLGVALGTAAIGVAVLLAAFMAGLGVGAALGGALARRIGAEPRGPLVAYGLLEIAVAAGAFSVPAAIHALGSLPEAWGLALGGALLVVPAAAMGATFPLAVAALAALRRRLREPEAGAAPLLYGLNTVGAVVGAVGAAYVLLPAFGTAGTHLVAILGSTAAGLAGLGLAWLAGGKGASAPDADHASAAVALSTGELATRDAKPTVSQPFISMPFAAAATLLAGLAGLALEVVLSRVLAMVLGGTVYAFATMLGAFLAGIGVGSLVAAAIARRVSSAGAALGACCALAFAAAGTLAAGYAVPALPWRYVELYQALGSSLLLEAALAGAVLLPPALGLGAAFAFLLRATAADADARRAGALYAWNTLGAVAGALGAGLVLVPAVGLDTTLALSVSALALAAGFATGRAHGAAIALALSVFLTFPAVAPSFPPSRLATGAFGYVQSLGAGVTREAFDAQFEGGQIQLVYHRDGRAASVTVEHIRTVRDGKRYETAYLKTNGKVEGSAPVREGTPALADMATQVTLAAFPLALHPKPRRAMVIGLGGGVTLGASLAFDLEAVDLVEIEPRVIEAVRQSPAFWTASGAALNDPRVRVAVADARRELGRLAPESLDVIVSQPSDPWLTGVANLFTVEAFRAGRRALREDGLFCQWVQLYGLDEAGLRTLVATFLEVFPNAVALRPRGALELVLVGSRGALTLDPEVLAARLTAPERRRWLERSELWPPQRFLGQVVLAGPELAAFAVGAAPSTDDRNRIELEAPRTRFVPPSVTEALAERLLRDRAPPRALLGGEPADGPEATRARRLWLAQGALDAGNVWTACAWALGFPSGEGAPPDEVEFLRSLGDAFVARGDAGEALVWWIEALRRDPRDAATHARVLSMAKRLDGGASTAPFTPRAPTPSERRP